jgi:hypothetical protein
MVMSPENKKQHQLAFQLQPACACLLHSTGKWSWRV